MLTLEKNMIEKQDTGDVNTCSSSIYIYIEKMHFFPQLELNVLKVVPGTYLFQGALNKHPCFVTVLLTCPRH